MFASRSCVFAGAFLGAALALVPQQAVAAPGDVQLVRQLGAAGIASGVRVAVNSSSAFVVGTTDGTLPGSPSANAGATDAFLANWTNAGVLRWVRQLGTAAVDRAGSRREPRRRLAARGSDGLRSMNASVDRGELQRDSDHGVTVKHRSSRSEVGDEDRTKENAPCLAAHPIG